MAGQFLGFFPVGANVTGPIQCRDSAGVAKESSSAPVYKIYGPGGAEVQNGSGTASIRDGGVITSVAANNPTVITSANHGLSNGNRVTITGASGGTGTLNADWTITVVNANSFSLNGSSSISGSWTTPGAWNVTGLYWWTHVLDSSVFEPGETYSVHGTATVSSVVVTAYDTFIVV